MSKHRLGLYLSVHGQMLFAFILEFAWAGFIIEQTLFGFILESV